MSNWCPNCEWAGNNSEAFYCKLCGTELIQQEEKACPKCKNAFLVPSNASFCDSCGIKLQKIVGYP